MPQRTAGSANRRPGSLVRARARVSPETAQTTVPTQDSRRWQKLLTWSQRKPLSTLLLPGRVAPDPTAKFECGCISGHGKRCRSLNSLRLSVALPDSKPYSKAPTHPPCKTAFVLQRLGPEAAGGTYVQELPKGAWGVGAVLGGGLRGGRHGHHGRSDLLLLLQETQAQYKATSPHPTATQIARLHHLRLRHRHSSPRPCSPRPARRPRQPFRCR